MVETRGSPFRAIGLLLLAWVTIRLLWTTVTAMPLPARAQDGNAPLALSFTRTSPPLPVAIKSPAAPAPVTPPEHLALCPSFLHGVAHRPAQIVALPDPPGKALVHPSPRAFDSANAPERRATPAPGFLLTSLASPGEAAVPDNPLAEVRPPLAGNRRRLGGYFWLFARQGQRPPNRADVPTDQLGTPRYGGSQAGAMLTYRLLGDESRYLSGMARVSTSFGDSPDREFALGARIRPLADVPLLIAAEHRFGLSSGLADGPALYAAAGIGPRPIVGNLDGDAYVQAGYRFGKSASYFFDGALSLQQPVMKAGRWKLTAGAGAWAGGQQDAQRLDIGPRLNLHVPIGELDARLSVDWRYRVAGDARPDSGAAIALTAGF